MTSEKPSPSDPSDRLYEAIVSFEEARDSGQNPDPKEWLERYADVGDRLMEYFAAQEKLGSLVAPIVTAVAGSAGWPDVPDCQIHELIGQGGMGEVFRGQDVDVQRVLAVKVLSPRHRDRPEYVRRFQEEARLTAQLQHPGIPPVHAQGNVEDGRPYFTMKLIKGRTLTELLEERSSPAADLPRFLAIFANVSQTLAYVHSQGVIHRDLKPGNIMVGAFGEVQVMDWGLAKHVDSMAVTEAGPAPSPPPQTGDQAGTETLDLRTMPGQAVGTYAYMPPEQARGELESVGTWSDVFGLGAILCQILIGRSPYCVNDAPHPPELFRRAREADLADAFARLDACGADAELITLAKSYLAPDPAARPRDAGVVAEQISAYQNAVQERLRQAELERAAAQAKAKEERKKRRWQLALAASVLLLLVGGSAAGFWYQQHQARLATEEAVRDQEIRSRKERLRVGMVANLDEAQRVGKGVDDKLGNHLEVSRLLSNINGWKEALAKARASWRQAKDLAGTYADVLAPELAERLQALDRELQDHEASWKV